MFVMYLAKTDGEDDNPTVERHPLSHQLKSNLSQQ